MGDILKIALLPYLETFRFLAYNNFLSVSQDCMYLHELGENEASFTKEDMQLG